MTYHSDINGINVSLRIVMYKLKIGLLSAWNKAEVIKKTGYTGPIKAATCK